MPDITFADISEWEPNLDAPAYLGGGYRVIIVRTWSGYRNDKMIPVRREYVRAHSFVAVGWYCYLAGDRDAASQATAFIASVGDLRANEFPILDLEEGGGDQVARAEAFFAVTDRWAGFPTTLYTGASFLKDQLGGAARWGKRPLWIAAYPSGFSPSPLNQPAAADFWQYSDRASFPGLAGGVDGSVFRGSAVEFLAMVRGGAPPNGPSGPPAPGADTRAISTVAMRDGRLESFALSARGEVFHCWQRLAGGWSSWQSLGTPGA